MAKTQPEQTNKVIIYVEPDEMNVNMPALIEEFDERIAGAQAAFKTLPKIVDEDTKQVHFQFRDLVNLRLQQFNERRMPFTRKLNEIVKEFTTREAELKRLAALTDDGLNAWAQAELRRTRDAQAAADAKLKAEQAKIALEGRIRELCRQRLNSMLDVVRGGAGSLVEKVDKSNFDKTKKRLQTEPKWTEEMQRFLYEQPTWITDVEHFNSVVNEEFEAIKADYLEQSAEILKRSLTILETALTNKEEAARLQEAEKQRQADLDAQKDLELKKDIAGQQAVAELDQEKIEAPKVRAKMKIDVLSNEAWLHMISWWFKYDPESETKDLSKKTFAQCKTFCEKWANDTGEQIIHESLEYVEDVKAAR